MDTFELLRTFREVAARRSFVHAAQALEVSRANVSKHVAELESRLGVRLLNRTTHSLSLTDAGQLLFERSAPLVDMLARTEAELHDRAQVPSGRLRITAPHGLVSAGLTPMLAAFMAEHPQVTVCLELDNRVLNMVDEGFDLALRVGRIRDDTLIVRRLRPVQFVVCATPGYWSEHGLPAHPDDLAGHDALLYNLPHATPEWRFVENGELLRVPLRSRLEASDPMALVAMALQGLGVVYLPDLLLQADLARGALVPVLQAYAPQDVWLFAAYAQRRHNSAALRALLPYLEQRWQLH